MNDLMARMLGLGSGSTLDAWTLSLQSRWPVAVLVGLLILAAAGAVFLYVREKSLRPSVRAILAGVRMLAVAVLLTMMFRPVIEAAITRVKPSSVLVLVDRSNSMDIRDTRKESVDLVEAGITLGRLPTLAPALSEGVFSARIKAASSAKALQLGDRAAAEKRIAECDAALASVEQMASTHAPPLDQTLLAELESVREQLNTLTTKRISSDEDHATFAATLDVIARDLNKWYERTVVSQSPMNDAIRAELALVSRRELVDAAVQTAVRNTFHDISGRSRLRMFSFSRGLVEWPVRTAETAGDPTSEAGEMQPTVTQLPESVTDGSATALGDALESALDRSAGELVSAVVVLTDGANNTGLDPLDAARKLRERGVRLVTVGVGLPEPDDAGLRNLVAPKVVFAGDLVLVRVQCHATGYENRTATLVAKLDGEEVARRSVSFTGQAQFEALSFSAGSFSGGQELEISLTPLPGEATMENNVIRRNLRVLDDKIRVLYTEGSPRWEYRYIRAVLKRDPRVDVQFVNTEGDKELAGASAEHLGRFPDSEAQVFEYDLVILGDVRASTFTPTQLDLMERLVRQRGGSMIALAGRKHLPAEYVDTPVSTMLPVRFDQEPWEEVSDSLHPVLTAEGRSSTVMSLADSAGRSQSFWSNVRPLFKIPPVTGAKPGAHILAELSDPSRPMPLIAWQRYGAGKVMFIGADQLWRLRARTGDTYHLKFWGQAVQFLTLSRLLGENRLAQLQTGRERYALGEAVEVFASAISDIYEPLTDPTFGVKVIDVGNGAEQPLTLKPVPGMPGLYHGFYASPRAGRYRVTTDADTGPGGLTLSSRTAGGGAPLDVPFEVLDETGEQLQTAMQRDLLAQMANVTGGQYLTLRDLPLLPKLVPEETRTTRYTREFALWDHWVFALIFVGLVAVEWAWRRHSNLA